MSCPCATTGLNLRTGRENGDVLPQRIKCVLSLKIFTRLPMTLNNFMFTGQNNMVSSISSLGASINIPGATTKASDNTAVTETGTAAQPEKINTRATPGAAAGASAESSDDSSEIVKQLKKQIEQLQKQLQQQQQALQSIQSSDQSEEAKAAAIAGAQAQVTATTAALQTAMGALLQAVTAEGGSSSGSMVSTTA